MSTICANCGGVDIEYDASRGDAVCVQCGSVLEDNIIVSEVSFQEQTSGATSVIGQFVSAEGQNNPLSGTGFHHGMGKGSREVTLMHARKRINTLGNLMKLNQHCIDSAFTYFKLALNLNLTRGRRAGLIDTACLYLVCRTEGTPHLLLDFSDVLQMNVYALGRAFLRLTNTLHINPPAIDPCLYIHRFAHKLELGDKEHEVSKTALRLVARMKRDWLHHGRRPTGLCGAALLIAARLHNFSRTVKEVAKVVKINENTVRKRLSDFKDTPSSRLTIEEFLQINLEQEHDPPSYSEARKKPKLATSSELDQDEEPSTSEEAAGLPESLLDGSDTMTNGGISLKSVEATIAKAQATEQFQAKIFPSLGLSTDLASLAKYADDIANENIGKEDGDSDLAELDDDEIESMLLNPEEVNLKSKIWFEENGDYLKEQEERREKLQAEKAAQGEKKKRGYKRRRPYNTHMTANSAGEAIQQMLVERKISSKINYDVLRELSDDNPAQDSKEQSSSTSFTATPPATQPPSLSRKRTFSLVDSNSGSSNSNKISSPGNYPSPKTSRLPSLKGPQGGFTSSLVKQTPLQPEPEPEEEPTLPTVEVVEETGPINYAEDGEDGDLDANLDEDDMTYPGDPLYLSDYEEDANYDDDGDDIY